MKPAVSLIILTLLFSSCHYLTKKIEGFEHVDVEQVSKNLTYTKPKVGLNKRIKIEEFTNSSLYLPDVLDTMYGVKLDNHPDAIIGTIDKMRITNDAFFLLDRYSSKSLKKFDREGKYICTIGKLGGGPGEFYQPTDFSITEKEVVIYDQFKKALLIFDLDGNFIKERQVPFIATSFHIYNDTTYIFHTLDSDNYHIPKMLNYSLHWADSSFSIKSSSAYREKDKYISFLSKNNMDVFNDKLYYHQPFNDTVYQLSPKGQVFYEYVYDFLNPVPLEYLLNENRSKFYKINDPNSGNTLVGSSFNPIVTENFLFTNVGLNNQIWTLLYCNNSGNVKLTYATYHHNSYILFNPFTNILNCEGDILVGFQTALELYNRIELFKRENTFASLPKEMIELYGNVDPNDNPILVFYKLKEF
jgi:hypothetical protein